MFFLLPPRLATVMFHFVSQSICPQKVLWTKLMKFLNGGCMISTSWLDFGSDPGHDMDTGLLKELLPLMDKDNIHLFLLIT